MKHMRHRILNYAQRTKNLGENYLAKLANNNYYTARAYYQYILAQSEKQYKESPIFVYSVGKVGSLTITETLKNLVDDRNIHHFHVLRPERMAVYEKFRRKKFPDIDGGDLRYVWRCQYIYKIIKNSSHDEKWKIITLVRDPVARNISDFFENSRFKIDNTSGVTKIRASSEWYGYNVTIVDNDLSELINIFMEKYDHDRPLNYFDLEFKRVLGIDLYGLDFPKAQGYKIIECKDADILILKLERLNDCAAVALKEFLQIDNFVLSNRNVSSDKDYAKTYAQFKKNITFPNGFLNKIYSSKMARHFYSSEEINAFKQRWSK